MTQVRKNTFAAEYSRVKRVNGIPSQIEMLEIGMGRATISRIHQHDSNFIFAVEIPMKRKGNK